MERAVIWPWVFGSILVHFIIFLFARQTISFVRTSQQNALSVAWVKLSAERPQKQIVEVPLSEGVKPKDARFLAERNQTVLQETRSETPSRGLPGSGPGAGPANDRAVTQLPLAQRGLKWEAKPTLGSASENPVAQPPLFGAGGAGSDFLPEELRTGAQNYVNAERFEHTGYYLEVKRKIEIAWNPRRALSSGVNQDLFNKKKLVKTVLGVTLNKSGGLEGLVVLSSSGDAALDGEAVRSFRVSAPFTEVPPGLIFDDGRLRFEFGFVIFSR